MAKVWAYRCSRTGLYFPGDYSAEWGRKYGKGLGPVPVSEALVNLYHSDIPATNRADQTMHPVAVCCAQVDLVQIEETEYAAGRAILQEEDLDMAKRMAVMRGRQLVNSDKLARIFPEEAIDARREDENRTLTKMSLAK
jgi:hypothetical protein